MSALLSVQGVSRRFGSGGSTVQVLDAVDLAVDEGELCVILGASGSGKSTLLNAIGGLDRPDAGRIVVAGREITALSPRDLSRYRRDLVGFVFQFYNLVANLTVRENVQLCERLTRHPASVDDLLADLGLTEHADKFPAQLSGGQQQRCAIARALVKRSALLLCDEPTGALDHATSLQMLGVLDDVNRRLGATVLLVTHNPAITQLADRVVEIRDGRVVRDERVTRRPVAELEW